MDALSKLAASATASYRSMMAAGTEAASFLQRGGSFLGIKISQVPSQMSAAGKRFADSFNKFVGQIFSFASFKHAQAAEAVVAVEVEREPLSGLIQAEQVIPVAAKKGEKKILPRNTSSPLLEIRKSRQIDFSKFKQTISKSKNNGAVEKRDAEPLSGAAQEKQPAAVTIPAAKPVLTTKQTAKIDVEPFLMAAHKNDAPAALSQKTYSSERPIESTSEGDKEKKPMIVESIKTEEVAELPSVKIQLGSISLSSAEDESYKKYVKCWDEQASTTVRTSPASRANAALNQLVLSLALKPQQGLQEKLRTTDSEELRELQEYVKRDNNYKAFGNLASADKYQKAGAVFKNVRCQYLLSIEIISERLRDAISEEEQKFLRSFLENKKEAVDKSIYALEAVKEEIEEDFRNTPEAVRNEIQKEYKGKLLYSDPSQFLAEQRKNIENIEKRTSLPKLKHQEIVPSS